MIFAKFFLASIFVWLVSEQYHVRALPCRDCVFVKIKSIFEIINQDFGSARLEADQKQCYVTNKNRKFYFTRRFIIKFIWYVKQLTAE